MTINLGMTHLRAVVALADHGTFTAAAASVGVAQSSLSRTVQEAEHRLRVPLFTRTTRRVALTQDGVAVVHVARGLVVDFDAGLGHVEGYLAGTRGALRVATLPSLAATLLPPFLLALRDQHPHVQITVDDGLSESVQESLATGVADLAVTALPGGAPAGVSVTPLATDDFFAAMPSDHPLADSDELHWGQLTGLPLVSFSSASSIRTVVDSALAAHQVVASQVVQAHNVGSVAGLVAGKLGIAAIPGFVLPLLEFARLRYVPLRPRVSRRIVLLRTRDRPLSPAVTAWTDLLTNRATPRPHLPGVTWHEALSADHVEE